MMRIMEVNAEVSQWPNTLVFTAQKTSQLALCLQRLFYCCVLATGFRHALTRFGSCKVRSRPRAKYFLNDGLGKGRGIEHYRPLPLRALWRDLAVGGQVQGVAQVAVRVCSIYARQTFEFISINGVCSALRFAGWTWTETRCRLLDVKMLASPPFNPAWMSFSALSLPLFSGHVNLDSDLVIPLFLLLC